MRNILTILSVLALLPACSTMNKRECNDGEWQQAGRADAVLGLPFERFTAQAKACSKHGIAPNQALYRAGYNDGLKTYCRAESGLIRGRKADEYRGICPADLEPVFLTGYLQGLQIAIFNSNADYQDARDRLRRARFRRISATTNEEVARADYQVLQLRQKLTNIRQHRNRLRTTVAAWLNQG